MAKLSLRMISALALVACLAMSALGVDSNETTTEMTTETLTTTATNDTNTSDDGAVVGGSSATATAGVLATLVTLFLAA
eukprot:CAMPEP_0170262426 /NCGR_PEP_ID=MMETSP0116_2-20130129/31097_1 /TAXON_ID=400756 /ORGANISM="Durinskia baltica, Strain CSIRO CS-38" /LENGTH=78 /DNA_ID=CAMNT_0010513497 /DNA_START=77 /DNA_END=313 /DNA_ORIENTATION=+